MLLKMRRYAGLFVFVLLIFCSSCTNYAKVDILTVGMSDFKLVSTNRAVITFKAYVNNPLNKEITLSSFDGKVFKDNSHFANVTLDGDVTIAPYERGDVYVKALVDLIDPLALLSSGLDISNWDKNTFRMDGKVSLKSTPGVKRSFKFKNVTLDQVIEKL